MLIFCRACAFHVWHRRLVREERLIKHLPLWQPASLFLLVSALAVVFQTHAQASVRSEYELKAAFLYNFTRFVSWQRSPDEAEMDLNLCVVGDDPFEELLAPIEGRSAQGRTIYLKYPSQLIDMTDCSVVFVSQSEARRLPQLITAAGESDQLTVSDIPDFARQGGVIGYVQQGNVIRFEINLRAAEASNLTIDSRLLELAVRVIQ